MEKVYRDKFKMQYLNLKFYFKLFLQCCVDHMNKIEEVICKVESHLKIPERKIQLFMGVTIVTNDK